MVSFIGLRALCVYNNVTFTSINVLSKVSKDLQVIKNYYPLGTNKVFRPFFFSLKLDLVRDRWPQDFWGRCIGVESVSACQIDFVIVMFSFIIIKAFPIILLSSFLCATHVSFEFFHIFHSIFQFSSQKEKLPDFKQLWNGNKCHTLIANLLDYCRLCIVIHRKNAPATVEYRNTTEFQI